MGIRGESAGGGGHAQRLVAIGVLWLGGLLIGGLSQPARADAAVLHLGSPPHPSCLVLVIPRPGPPPLLMNIGPSLAGSLPVGLCAASFTGALPNSAALLPASPGKPLDIDSLRSAYDAVVEGWSTSPSAGLARSHERLLDAPDVSVPFPPAAWSGLACLAALAGFKVLRRRSLCSDA